MFSQQVSLGTKKDPIKLNQPAVGFADSYTVSINTLGFFVSKGKRVYFEVDPISVTSRPCSMFSVTIKTFNNPNMRFYKTIKEKATGRYVVDDERIYQNYAMSDTVRDGKPYEIDRHVFIYAVENTGVQSGYGDNIEIWWTFIKEKEVQTAPDLVTYREVPIVETQTPEIPTAPVDVRTEFTLTPESVPGDISVLESQIETYESPMIAGFDRKVILTLLGLGLLVFFLMRGKKL